MASEWEEGDDARSAVLQLTQADEAVVDSALARIRSICSSKDGRSALTAESAASRLMMLAASLTEGKFGPITSEASLRRCTSVCWSLEQLLRASREHKAGAANFP
ncbi:hypothetical protein FNF29_07086 [Cafeteria roenbergensis]|uniref:Uncharacterized protein n=1 Tax=Cafeteria roenbergensis TaxID=33653 RepID=A0A5A8C4C7_CAFRO|nr:hypothetical protein FNF29_07086 [Cafeteria roenbergensis]|eukprot:KAA0147873.1 hypothetical protein FNF29_07086 [Cafeteria roenbergensis]